MREILFRGKSKETGEWAYGDLSARRRGDNRRLFVGSLVITDYTGTAHDRWNIVGECITEVIPETVGQWTGLVDKNGVKIFEGDVVDRHDSGAGFYDKLTGNVTQIVLVEYLCGGFEPFVIYGWECPVDPEYCEVIGNIHDNPKLLKKVKMR